MKPFKPFHLPLRGVHLIEASAGTGKTYTLTALFLRLVVEQGISVDRILVVTYTKAATEELKTRIRHRLVNAKRSWHQEKVDDPFLDELRQRAPSAELALQRIHDALIDFDRAAIFTIHGFCQRVLQYFTFETGHLFQSSLVHDDSPFLQETAEDFWRRYISRAPKELAVEALRTLRGPQLLAKTLKRCRFPSIAISPNDRKPALFAIKPWREIAEEIVQQWPKVRSKVKDLLQYDGLNGRTYGVCTQKKGHSGATPRQIKIDALCSTMDQWSGDYPLFKQFELFCAHRLRLATKKGKETPEHTFFNLCERGLELHDKLKGQLQAYLKYLKVRLYHLARSRMDQKKTLRNVIFFDDLLIRVHQALKGRHSKLLVDAIRLQYPIALVDEFQDTDQLQYEIFFRLFAGDQSLLAMIGDPKQAIYSFRGADLFSYLQAAQSAKSSTTLTTNWRSTPGLVEAVNTIFSNHSLPFGFKQIVFEPAVPADITQRDASSAMRLWYMSANGENTPKGGIPSVVAESHIAKAVALETVDLLGKSEMMFFPEDIAILVRTHHQAQIVKQALAEKKVPAVLHSAGRIFSTAEAEQMARVIAAVASPSEMVLVRSALAGPLFGWRASDLRSSVDKDNPRWQIQWESFLTYHHIWGQYGFYAMFRQLMIREGIKKRVLGYDEGERWLTNLLHLAELLHQAETDHGLGPEGLVKWLESQRQSEEVGSDEQQLRLESDARAVRIITMHKSKGLQFKVVFCPYTWGGIKDTGLSALFHHPEKHDQLTLALGPEIPQAFRIQAVKEELAENLRMLYVALTRAQQRCYWVWGRFKEAAISAPAYLLHGQGLDVGKEGWMASLKEYMINGNNDQLMLDLDKLALSSNGSICIDPLPVETDQKHKPDITEPVPLSCRFSTRRFENRWRIASFSAMTTGQHAQSDERPDRDTQTGGDLLEQETGNNETLFSFHKGARAGLFFHDLLENWDHTAIDHKQWNGLVAEKLLQHGYESEWQSAISMMLKKLANVPLTSEFKPFTLEKVAHDARINEMGFYFPLKPVEASQIKKVFEQFSDLPERCNVSERLGRLHFAPMKGVMKGFIDMVFSHDGRYYLIDWKSNHLGSGYGDYVQGRLEEAMGESYYFLQYHIYTVALDQLLRQRLVDYDYKRHFGGVFYIFLRGLEDNSDGSNGIFYDLPDAQLVEALNRLLIENDYEH